MNSLIGQVSEIIDCGSMSLVTLNLGEEISLKSIVIDTPETAAYLRKGTELNLLFKETEVVIGTGKNPSISLQNQISATIGQIESGILLTKLVLHTTAGQIVSIVSTADIRQMHLEEGNKVVAMIKSNEIMLSEC